MNLAFFIGRLILGAFYLYYAQNHLKNSGAIAGYAASKGVPAPQLAVLGTGVMMALGGLSFITGIMPTIGAIIIIVFLLPTSVMIHNFWTVKDPMARMGETTNFLKNMALVGSALMFLAIPQPWPLSLGF